MRNNKMESFTEIITFPLVIFQKIKSKTIRWILILPLMFLQLIVLAVFGVPILFIMAALLIEQLVNDDF